MKALTGLAAAGLVVLLSLCDGVGDRRQDRRAAGASGQRHHRSGWRATPRPTGLRRSPRRTRRFGRSTLASNVKVQYQLGHSQDEVRSDARAGNAARRDRVRQHRHAEVHVPPARSHRSTRRTSRTPAPGCPARQGRRVHNAQDRLHVPHYAGARGVIYRTDQYKAAGIKKHPEVAGRVPDRRPEADGEVRRQEGSDATPRSTSRPLLVRRDVVRLRLRGQIATTGAASGSARSTRRRRLEGLDRLARRRLKLSRANKTGDEAHPQQALVFAEVQGRLVRRERLGVAVRARTRSSATLALTSSDRRSPDAEPHEGVQVHADLPRRLGPRRPRDEQRQGARSRLDRRLHEHERT